MTTLLNIYIIGFIILPIITIALDKIFPGSMNLEDEFMTAMILTSVLWPIGVLIVFLFLLIYWHNS